MEFTVAKKDFAGALAKAQGIPEQKNLGSVMSNILLESVGLEEVRLTAVSYETSVVALFPAQIRDPGAVALSGRSLFDAVRMLPDAPVVLKSKENDWADVSAGRTRYNIPGVNPANMPERPPINVGDQVAFPKEILIEMVDRVAFAMSTDEMRPNLNGIYMKLDPAEDGVRLTMVATDGHRLSQMIRYVPDARIDIPFSVILHRKGVVELKRFLDHETKVVHFGAQRNEVVFQAERGMLQIRQIELDYPEYRRVIPMEFNWKFDVDRMELIRAVQQVGVVIPTDKTPTLDFVLSDHKLLLEAKDAGKGQAEAELDVQFQGQELRMTYSNRYLLDALNAMPGETLTFAVRDLKAAARLTTPDDENVLQLIMPVGERG